MQVYEMNKKSKCAGGKWGAERTKVWIMWIGWCKLTFPKRKKMGVQKLIHKTGDKNVDNGQQEVRHIFLCNLSGLP